MLVLISGVLALAATPTRSAVSQTATTWVSVQGLLLVMLVIQAFSLWEQRHLKALRGRLVDQMEAATTERTRANQLYGISIIDPLTGLFNRRYGERRLREEILRAATTGDSLLVVALDFDRFKEINDRHGHAAGDSALKEFSRRLRSAIRASDVPVRVGGDEFIVVLPECPPDQAQTVFSRLTAFDLDLGGGTTVRVSYSRGVSRFQVGDTVQSMIQRADARLYEDKATKKGSAPDAEALARGAGVQERALG